jgi:hypothetical protein
MNSTELAAQIEIFLLAAGEHVPVKTLCDHFGIPERLLRADGKRRPLCHRFAISSSKNGENGLKHIRHCTTAERLAYKHARKKVLIANARALQEYDRALHNCLTGKHPNKIERHTGQGLLPI